MKRIFVFMSFALLLCVQGFAQRTQEFVDAQARVSNGDAEIHVKPTIVEVRVLGGPNAAPFTDEWELTADDVIGMGGRVADIRAYGSFLSTKKHECQIILNPVFLVRSNNKGGATVTVSGVPGVFENWHSAEKDDFEWLINERYWAKDQREVAAPVIAK